MAIAQTRTLTIDEEYRQKFSRSGELFERARGVIAGGITHDGRHFSPFPVYVDRAEGAKKWDADGNEMLDYWMGHGALLLGHSNPEVTAAIVRQAPRGTHHGACHELEVEWAELVQKLIPSAERVRFTMSGTESTMLAMRDARGYTGKSKILRFQGHFHGWHDYAMVGYQPPFDTPTSAGVPDGCEMAMLTARPNDIDHVRELLDSDDDVAAIILEPGGGSNGTYPTNPEFLKQLRALATERGVILIFDEVITGFRYAPGGAQQYYGVTPDMTTLAKIVAGGLPGGAVVGKAEIMEIQQFSGDAKRDRFGRVLQQGTFNASPVTAAAAIACLKQVATGKPHEIADRLGDRLREGMNGVLKRVGVPGLAYGESSVVTVGIGEGVDEAVRTSDVTKIAGTKGPIAHIRKGLLIEGIDVMRNHFFTSMCHTDADIDRTVEAFERVITRMQRESLL